MCRSCLPRFQSISVKSSDTCNITIRTYMHALYSVLLSTVVGASLSEPQQVGSRCVHHRSIVCTKTYITNTECPTLGGHHTSIACTKIYASDTE